MADLDENVIENDYEDTGVDNTPEYEAEEEEEITLEQAKKWREDLKKASKKIAELKSLEKQKQKEPTTLTEEKLALREEVTEFLAENKDLKEYKSEILKYREQWFTMKQAVALVENDDKTIENRKKTNSMNVTDWENSWKSTYTYDELEKMTQAEYNRVKDLQIKGKVTFKR